MEDWRHNAPQREPWHDDVPLEPEAVRRILHEDRVPLAADEVEPLGTGWDFKVFRVDGDWAVRFPKRPDCVPFFHQELDALAGLEALRAAADIAIPSYEFVVREPSSYPLPYGAYRLLPGEPLLDLDPAGLDLTSCAQRLGEFLALLHRMAPLSPPVRCVDPFPNYLPDIREELDALAPALPPDLRANCATLLASDYPAWSGEPAFRHADLGPEHLLVDPATGLLTGIIDWGDSSWGDPLLDFVGWWAWTGDGPTRAALASYGLEPDATAWARLRYRGGCVAISEAFYGYRSGRDDIFANSMRSLERLHASGQLRDPWRSVPSDSGS